jgi:hypothetical protein
MQGCTQICRFFATTDLDGLLPPLSAPLRATHVGCDGGCQGWGSSDTFDGSVDLPERERALVIKVMPEAGWARVSIPSSSIDRPNKRRTVGSPEVSRSGFVVSFEFTEFHLRAPSVSYEVSPR